MNLKAILWDVLVTLFAAYGLFAVVIAGIKIIESKTSRRNRQRLPCPWPDCSHLLPRFGILTSTGVTDTDGEACTVYAPEQCPKCSNWVLFHDGEVMDEGPHYHRWQSRPQTNLRVVTSIGEEEQ